MRMALTLLWTFPAATLAQAPGITVLGPSGVFSTMARSVSDDGTVVVGVGTGGGFRWTEAGGMVILGPLNGGPGSQATAVSRDGNVVVGAAPDGAQANFVRAIRWTQADGVVSLGVLNGGSDSFANGTNRDGSVVVGDALDGAIGNASRAFRWTQATGMVSLGTLNGGFGSSASAVSADGSVVVGEADDGAAGGAVRAFRWTQAGGMTSLGTLPGTTTSQAMGVSADGSVVVGTAIGGLPTAAVAFRWTEAGGMMSLGFLKGGSESEARAVSGDGRVVVGLAEYSPTNATRAFRWTQATGMQSVEDWLRATGVRVPVDITQAALGVNSDGSVVVGVLENGPAFIARAGSGLMTFSDLQTSLSGNTVTAPQVAGLGGTALHGAHSRPLAHRTESGKSCLWTAGDVGRDDHGDRDGSFGLAEVGGCHRFTSGVQGSLSVGRSSSRQTLPFDGRSDARATYGIAELLGNVAGTSLWPSIALLYQSGDVDARRGYVNAGVQDASSGRPAVSGAAVRLRVDWENALRLGALGFTPYADASYARTRIGAYTETGGGFPASFDSRTEKATELRIGTDSGYPLSSAVKLVGRLEAAHRVEKTGAATSGTVLGLFSFDFPGQQNKRDWARVGLGADARLGAGTASAMLNATSQGARPSYWLNVSYQVAF